MRASVPGAIIVSSKLGNKSVAYTLSSRQIESRFRDLVFKWKADRIHSSSVKKMVDASYLGIIGLGPSAVPLLLRELEERPDHWLIALNAITQEDPAEPGATFSEAVSAWLRWGRERKFLT
jgi:hypothetical protein